LLAIFFLVRVIPFDPSEVQLCKKINLQILTLFQHL